MNFMIDWGLSAIDTIFSTKSESASDGNCPPQSYPAGYSKDPYGKWQPLCLSLLSVEDSEDIYIFGLRVTGILLILAAVGLVYRKIGKTAELQGAPRLPVMLMEIGRNVQDLSRRLDLIAARLGVLARDGQAGP